MEKLFCTCWAVGVVFFTIPGCNSSPEGLELQGIVVTYPNLADSFLGTSIRDTDEELTPIAGAKVKLSLDKEGHKLLKGYEAESNPKGLYTIKLAGLPRSPTEYGNDYYLIVEKDGYDPLITRLTIGARAVYMRNTVFLKALPAK
jgi:hypothetical protein